ncbi:hypothetical protein B0T20DRAFT_31202 [Sordaria brevicollis]|uniref:Uncharacterized protein n=1 Tax=Sordaria brevicollis TaxID=83679 RepID=A0AAE0PPI2_SORBR|nr:hypothetical protein B0T20DRAFT_31202 [Sordaria brevicollis]
MHRACKPGINLYHLSLEKPKQQHKMCLPFFCVFRIAYVYLPTLHTPTLFLRDEFRFYNLSTMVLIPRCNISRTKSRRHTVHTTFFPPFGAGNKSTLLFSGRLPRLPTISLFHILLIWDIFCSFVYTRN